MAKNKLDAFGVFRHPLDHASRRTKFVRLIKDIAYGSKQEDWIEWRKTFEESKECFGIPYDERAKRVFDRVEKAVFGNLTGREE